MVKRKNPLRKRYLRELKSDFGKYLAIFLLLLLLIGEISGFLVADKSMRAAYESSTLVYNVEHGNFTVQKKLNKSQQGSVESLGIQLDEIFFTETELTNGSKLRIFKNRGNMDRVCVMKGRLAQKNGEIAIDRLYAKNNNLSIGDEISDGTRTWTITGLVALSDYSSLFENNNDPMYDAVKFAVSVISEEEFSELDADELTYRYAWQYPEAPEDEKAEKNLADRLSEQLSEILHLEGFLPHYMNQAICFTGKDMGDEKSIMELVLYVVIVIIAFVFAVTTSNTILKEAGSIGTLRATGYTRFELVRHYMTMPLLVTLFAALVGNLFGYTIMKNINADLYYSSYSLPTFITLWSTEAFIKTTLIPIVIMLVINFAVLWKQLSLSPLQFLRRELRKPKKRGVVRLNPKTNFFSRFRMRIIFQNVPDYIVLFLGIFAAELLLMFGLAIPKNLEHFQDTLPERMLSKYQYILTIPQGALNGKTELEKLLKLDQFRRAVDTETEDAEEFMAYTLRTPEAGDYRGESVLIYGINPDSQYIDLNPAPGEVYISSAYADKFGYRTGSNFTLYEEYGDQAYSFTVSGIYDYNGALALFMPREDVNTMFGFEKDMFAGYFSNQGIKDVPDEYISQIIDYSTLSKVSRQLLLSLDGLMKVVVVFSVLIFFILMYVLSKIIIEKNGHSISMTKILGYKNKEISSLYIHSTSIVVAISLLIALPPVRVVLEWMYNLIVASKINGWVPFYLNPWIYLEIIVMGLAAYFAVSIFEYKKIRRIPMEEILKNTV